MFLENNVNGLVYMTSDCLPYRHLFTTRYGGVSTGHLTSLNLIGGHGDQPENIRENFTRVAALLNVGPDDCCVTKQVHGNTVRIVTRTDRHVCLSEVPYEADGIVTAEPGLPIFCFTADCLLYGRLHARAALRPGTRGGRRRSLRLAQFNCGHPRQCCGGDALSGGGT